MRECTKCRITKSFEEFHRDRTRKDGREYVCKECKKEKQRDYIERNREVYLQRQREYDLYKRDKKGYYIKNQSEYTARTALRRGRKMTATPKWLTEEMKKEIKDFYKTAKEIQWLSEEKLEVDHIVPLRNDRVCGLHVPWNLQILPRSLNRSKGGKLCQQ